MRATSILAVIAVLCLFATGATAAQPTETPIPPDLPKSSVIIPWSDFKGILKTLTEAGVDPVPPAPPFDAVVSSASYKADVREDGVLVEVTVEVLALKEKGWSTVPIMRLNAPLSKATLDGKPTALADKNDGWLHLLVKGAGAHKLNLTLLLDRTKKSGPDQFDLPTVKSQVNLIEVNMPSPDMDVKLPFPGHMVSVTKGSATVAAGSFPPRERVTVSWTRKAPAAAREAARVSAEVRTMLTIGEGLGVYTAIIDYDIRHKPISSFSMNLPKDVTVADVSTDGLVDWEVKNVKDGQQLSIYISFEATGRHQVAVTYEKMLPAEEKNTFQTADLILKDVVHEVGYLAVAVRTNVQVDPKDGSLKNLAILDPSELPRDLRGNGDQKVLHGFKYVKHPSSLELNVVKHKDASVLTCEVQQADYKVLLTERGKQLMEATYRIANRSLQYLSLTLPEGTDLWGVYRDGAPVKAAEADGKILLPIFQGGTDRPFVMRIIAFRSTSKMGRFGARTIELPLLDVGIRQVNLALYTPYKYRLFGVGGTLKPGDNFAPIVVGPSSKELGALGSIADQLDEFSEDKRNVNWNILYRQEQSKSQMSTINVPATAANASYLGNMQRGALPVKLDITWEGAHRNFSTRIVDPSEMADVSFYYNSRKRSSLVVILVLLLSVFAGERVSRAVFSRLSKHVVPLTSSQLLLGLSSLVVIGLLASVFAVTSSIVVLGLLLGLLICLAFWNQNHRKAKAAEKSQAASSYSSGQPVEAQPVEQTKVEEPIEKPQADDGDEGENS